MMADHVKRDAMRELAGRMRAVQAMILVFKGDLVKAYQYGLNQRKELGPGMTAREMHETEQWLASVNGVVNAVERMDLVYFPTGTEEEGE